MSQKELQEFRCHSCKFLLYKGAGEVETEVICAKCRRINYPSRTDQVIGLRGKDFQSKSLDHNCYNCQRLLFRSIGLGLLETKCKFCASINEFNTFLIRQRRGVKKAPDQDRFVHLKESIAR